MSFLNPPPIDRVILLQSPPPMMNQDLPPSILEDAPDSSHPIAFSSFMPVGPERITIKGRFKNVPIIVIDPAK